MNLTVTSRIIGGAALVMLLLIALSLTGLKGMNNIERGLLDVTDKASPMLTAGSQNLSSLLEATVEVNRYHQTEDLAELPAIIAAFEEKILVKKQTASTIKELAQDYPDILQALEASQNQSEAYVQLIPDLFSTHQQALETHQKIISLRSDFEDLADELDTYLFDFAEDLGDGTTASLLKSMSNLIREATVSVTDTLLSKQKSVVANTQNEIRELNKELDEKFAQVQQDFMATNNEYYSDTLASLTKFKQITSGEDNLLSVYSKRLALIEQADALLMQSKSLADQAKAQINNVFTQIQTLTGNIKEQAELSVNSSRLYLLIIAVSAVIVAVGVNFWVLKSITTPLDEVLSVIVKVSEGDLTNKAKVYSNDEFGKLSTGFNELIEALNRMLTEIKMSSEQLSASAEQTTEISRQSNFNINQQKEQTDMIATAMTEMTATVEEVANSASNTLLEVQKANSEAVDGKGVVQDSIETINKLAEEIEQAAEVTDKLNEYSTNIGAVLDVIRGIADQTNLLALNAAIEAARAGEQGRGFAVVADEVRTLASKTQESTSEIQEMIERLQAGAQEAVSVMKLSRNEAQNSVEKTAVAGQSLEKITEAVNVINDMSTHIASAAEEQSAVSLEMNQNVESISELADKTAQGSSENLSASQELARLAEHLQVLVSRFKF